VELTKSHLFCKAGFGRDTRAHAVEFPIRYSWGIVDVEDCIADAEFVAAQGRIDARRMAIRGSSASGFTMLCALAFRDVFAADARHCGVSDLAVLDADTHKFESYCTAGWVTPPATREAVQAARSPFRHDVCIRAPMVFFQGLEDRVVPPSQGLVMVEALRAQRAPVTSAFEGGGHGFRQQVTIAACLPTCKPSWPSMARCAASRCRADGLNGSTSASDRWLARADRLCRSPHKLPTTLSFVHCLNAGTIKFLRACAFVNRISK